MRVGGSWLRVEGSELRVEGVFARDISVREALSAERDGERGSESG